MAVKFEEAQQESTTWMTPSPTEAFKENAGITQTGGAAAVLIAVPVSVEGLLCLLPDLLRHVCLETQVSFLTGHLSFTWMGDVKLSKHCTLLICSFWFKCFYNSLNAPLL